MFFNADNDNISVNFVNFYVNCKYVCKLYVNYMYMNM